MINVRQSKIFHGANIWSSVPIILLSVDLGELEDRSSVTIPGFVERLTDMMPSLAEHTCSGDEHGGFLQRLSEGTRVWHVIKHAALDLQNLVRDDIPCTTLRRSDESAVFDVIYQYESEKVGLAAGHLAVRLVNHLVYNAEPAFDLEQQRAEQITALVQRETYGSRAAAAIIAAAQRRGIPMRRLPQRQVVQFGTGKYQKRIWTSTTSETSSIAAKLASNKLVANKLLREVGIPVPDGALVRNTDAAVRAATRIGYPVVLKPGNSNHGNGVWVNLTTEKQVRECFPVTARKSESGAVIVERFIVGKDYRILVVNEQIVAVYERVPAQIEGDGERSVRQLIDEANADPRRAVNPQKARISIDAQLIEVLEWQGLSLDDVPDVGQVVHLTRIAYTCVGATAINSTDDNRPHHGAFMPQTVERGGIRVDRTDEIHPDNVALAQLAVRTIGLDVAGIDLITPDISKPMRVIGGAINEVNSGPDMHRHEYPQGGLPRQVGRAVVDMLFPPGQPVRVPVVAVTGAGWTTSTSHSIAHLLRTCGRTVGLATSSGLYLDEVLLQAGDFCDMNGAQMVLNNPAIDYAVLETSGADMLENGLGFSSCDVAVVTGVMGDQLEASIQSPVDLFRARAIVPGAVHRDGATVLNADDPWAVELAHIADSEIIYYSTADNPAVRDHVRAGGRAIVLRQTSAGGMITTVERRQETDILPVSQLPETCHAQGATSIVMSLAAVSVGIAQGVPIDDIRRALRSFVSVFSIA